jgi:hypothetical protein
MKQAMAACEAINAIGLVGNTRLPRDLSEDPEYVKTLYAAAISGLQGLLDAARALVEEI